MEAIERYEPLSGKRKKRSNRFILKRVFLFTPCIVIFQLCPFEGEIIGHSTVVCSTRRPRQRDGASPLVDASCLDSCGVRGASRVDTSEQVAQWALCR